MNSSDAKSDYVQVFVRDYAAQLRTGIREHEKQSPQTIIINVECEIAKPPRYDDLAEDSLDRVIDYGLIYKFITTELVAAGHIPLLETIAEMIIFFCFRDPRIVNVRVRLEKPNLKPGMAGAGIELFRIRSST